MWWHTVASMGPPSSCAHSSPLPPPPRPTRWKPSPLTSITPGPGRDMAATAEEPGTFFPTDCLGLAAGGGGGDFSLHPGGSKDCPASFAVLRPSQAAGLRYEVLRLGKCSIPRSLPLRLSPGCGCILATVSFLGRGKRCSQSLGFPPGSDEEREATSL